MKHYTITSCKQFRHPFTALLSGSTGSGKTVWICRFLSELEHIIANGIIAQVLYCYGEINEKILDLEKCQSDRISFKTCRGVPTEEFLQELASFTDGKLLVVLDDLIVDLKESFLNTLFTRGSHNWGVSVFLITQHLFAKELRVVRPNCHYIILMRNPSGELQIRNIATQLFPRNTKFFIESYKNATASKFSYLVIDMHPETEDQLRLKTHIYPDETTVVYLPKQN